MDEDEIERAAGLLNGASESGVPTAPLTEACPGLSVEDAYAIQLHNTELRLADGATVVGHKVGLTSLAMQQMLGVEEPDYGVIFDDMLYGDGDAAPSARFLQPRVEIEIAFRLHTPLSGPGITLDDVLAATESVAPAIEIIDSRIANWKITLADTVADNASSAAIVLGKWVPVATVPDLAEVGATLSLNGIEMASGHGSDVLGHPAEAVAWLGNKLASFGTDLLAGQLVMPGSCTKALDVAAGDAVTGAFHGLGTVTVSFT
jgi:2-oxo-3-hexenedioate decarboxylase/2-keto-4-pentenoate hydratase